MNSMFAKFQRDYGLHAKLEKCCFDCNQVEFLGYIVSPEGMSMDRSKVHVINETRQDLLGQERDNAKENTNVELYALTFVVHLE